MLHSEFDKLAEKFRVFKVETIGDCYVAVTGLPQPQETHAIIMSRFAEACNVRLAEIRSQLAETLGDDTALLSMRTGIHVSRGGASPARRLRISSV